MAVEGADEKPGLGETRFDVRDHGPVFFPEAGEPGVEVLPGSRSAPFRGVPFGVPGELPVLDQFFPGIGRQNVGSGPESDEDGFLGAPAGEDLGLFLEEIRERSRPRRPEVRLSASRLSRYSPGDIKRDPDDLAVDPSHGPCDGVSKLGPNGAGSPTVATGSPYPPSDDAQGRDRDGKKLERGDPVPPDGVEATSGVLAGDDCGGGVRK